jgi:hypothetical protein
MNLPATIKATTGHVFTLEDQYVQSDTSCPLRCYTLHLPSAVERGRKVGSGYAGLDVFPDGIHALAVVHKAEDSTDYSLGPFEFGFSVETSLITAADNIILLLKEEEVPLPPPA